MVAAMVLWAVMPPLLAASPDAPSDLRPGSPAESLADSGQLFPFNSFIQAYEPNEIGYTVDQGKESFMDFTVSMMLPLLPGESYPPRFRSEAADFWRAQRYERRLPYVYFAVTQRAGQYLGTRHSSPVVGKRFNPLISFRWWGVEPNDDGIMDPRLRSQDPKGRESQDNFLEFVYAHESNGQYIDTPTGFNDQLITYEHDGDTPLEAYHAARDNISRGWDYLGVQYARSGDADLLLPVIVSVRAKVSYYLPNSPPQGSTEEYNAWEGLPDGKPRRDVDGVSLRVNLIRRTTHGEYQFFKRISLIGTTGYADLLRYDTVQGELGVMVGVLPLTVWYRYGYNGDQTDYFHKSQSYGIKFSFWRF